MYSISTFAVLGLAAITNAHMIMNTPVPFGKSTLQNSPLSDKGSDFPCQQRPGVYEAEGASNSMALGSTQPLKFTGGASHGGGSCQISITYDKAPNKNSVFKVIHSIEGGCPVQGVAGNVGGDPKAPSPTEYSFQVPESLPAGDAVLAWTWFNKVGNREMYMNCAPIKLTAGKTKRDEEELMTRNITQLMERDTAAYNALPDMFVANIGNGCATKETYDLIFPNPGDSVTSMGSGPYTAPVGCAAASVAPVPAKGGPPASSAASTPVASASSPPSLPGGVFATVPASKPTGAGPAATPVPSVPAVASPATPAKPSTLVTSAAPSKASSASTPAGTDTTGTGSAFAAGSACTTEGQWNCIGGSSFQQCASGTWSVVQQMASGMSCTAGQSSSLSMKAAGAKPKRALRFPAPIRT